MRLDNPDNNTRSGASSSSTPPLHAEVRAAVRDRVYQLVAQKAYAMGGHDMLSSELRQVDEYTDAILQAVADALVAGLPERRNTLLPKHAELQNVHNRGWNDCLDAVTRVIGELLGCSPMSSDVSKTKDTRL